MARCRSCQKTIFFAVSASTGSRIPLDMQPSQAGTFVPVRDDSGEVQRRNGLPIVEWLTAAQSMTYSGQRWISHFATCPAAKAHRRKRVRI